jgi:NAD-dependent SIR2 family protein deacetylase
VSLAADQHAIVLEAAHHVMEADGVLIASGAGMGVDSGLPDFRGREGFWRAYPALGRAGLAFEQIANPAAFARDATLAWGFYGHRLALYRRTVPHAGFAMLQQIGAAMRGGLFVFTSNVDGQFQKAGFDTQALVEVHGSIHHLQCQHGCSNETWSAEGFAPEVDEAACRLINEPPRCRHCGEVARPNILMFDDWAWLGRRTASQLARLEEWTQRQDRPPLTIEIGAGTGVITVRSFAEHAGGPLIRINLNPEEAALAAGVLHLRCGALEGITAIHQVLVAKVFLQPSPSQSH